ncbi:hypothetical protein H8356DRAFT_962598 [Neocallimastix lanati (nom. inval.)]|jgi:hypothetical protein|uniref:Uncharacterized protein n=1 Tax=Neocallimastix californiae TaxID=1754190 RepID=A0A1Y2ACB0_9FUNG|nr:hypothetical protein H8356DRAFT_962598 [Neocallimastix sp. JGI-2020a]ORY20132.1 hypothetical protein LY90DRAFT_517036 [Neocallimastix californiae]|eukprot:ORY20132.1 hypothetical protein LY90DRAFT_517036 [Neocallimastix californiae]
MPSNNISQGDEWQVQVSKRKKNNQRKQKKGQKYSSKEQFVTKNKRDGSNYYQTSKKTKEQNGNKNKNGKRSNKFENKMKKQNRVRDNIIDLSLIERKKNLSLGKPTSLLKIQLERQQINEKECSLNLNSKELLVPNKTISEMSDVTAVSVTSLASVSNSITSSTLTQTNSLKDQIGDSNNDEVNNNDVTKEKLSETTLLNKENDEKQEISSSNKLNSISNSENHKSSSSLTINKVNTNDIKSQKKKSYEISVQKDEGVQGLENECSLSTSSSVTSFNSEQSTNSESNSGDDNESIITAKNDREDSKIAKNEETCGNKKDEEICEKDTKKEEKKNNNGKKDELTEKVLEFNFKNYTDVKPFIPKHLKVQQDQSKVEIIAPKPQVAKHNNHTKSIIERKHYENENTTGRKTKEINKIIRIDPSCLHQKDGHIVPIPSYIMNMKNLKSNNNQEILQRNIQQKTNELQESKKKKYEELRKSFDNNNGNGDNRSQGYQSLPIRESESNKVAKKTEEKVVRKPQVRKTMSNSTLEVSSSLKNRKEHYRTSSFTMIHSNMVQKNIPNLVEYRDDDCVCRSICQLDVSSRIENEYNNVKCYNDPMEQSLTRVKPNSIKRSSSIQNITTTLTRKESNQSLLLGSGGCMTVTNTVTTCKTVPRLRASKSFSWLKGTRNGLENTHITTVNTTTTTTHTNTLYTNLVGSKSYYPIVVLPTATVQELSVETTSRKLRNSTSLPNMMSKLFKKLSWPFGSNIGSEVAPLAVDAK